MKKTKIALGLPWYGGPDVDTYPDYMEMFHYLGRTRERSLWFQRMREMGISDEEMVRGLAPIDELSPTPQDEVSPADGVFEFALANQTRLSLPGLARERIVDSALQWGADWLFMFDYDMKFPLNTILRLLRHNKPVVGALGFTARDPVMPCLYKIREGVDPITRGPTFDSEVVYDYPKTKALLSDSDIGGSLALGAGIVLYNMNVFRQIPKPWFNSTGCGEDWFFCVRCHLHNIPRYVDTSIPTQHKAHRASWYTADTYWQARETNGAVYDRLIKRLEVL